MIITLQTAAVMPLTHENFDEVVDGSKNVFVKFYAPIRVACVVSEFSGVVIARHSHQSTRLLEIPSQIRGNDLIG